MSDVGESQHSPADSGAVTRGNVASSSISSSRTKRYKVRAGRSRSSATGESSEEGADQGFFLDDEGTSVTTEMLAQLRKAYDIPSSVELSLPRPGFRPSRPDSSEVVIHRQSFEYGLRLPIQPFFAQILSGLGVAPAQLSSMAWRNLAGLYILWKEVLGVEPTIEDVHATFTLTTAPKKPGLYYLRTYTGQPYLVPQVNPNTADKAWDDFWFVVSGKWTRDLSRDTDLKSVREYVATNLSETDIVTEERLAKVGLIPPPSTGALGDEVLTLSSATRRMAEGSKTDLAFLQLMRDRMAKAAGASSQRAATGSEGSGKSAATSSGLPPRPKCAKKVEGPGWTSQLVVDLEGVLGSHFSHASRALPALKQVLDFSDLEKGSEVVGLSHNQAIDMASHLFLQVIREFLDMDLHYMDFGFDREALVAKFGKEQNPADVTRSSRQLTSGHPLNLEVSPPHSDQEEDDSDDEGSQSGKGKDT
ncbi:hypothetical protein OWV82_003897 [Melia azedarach]|uniref:Uncharacterized protein n=1 Tax=Melia azedarach TaxID=155640 RepID=A0ACC1YNF9_MELAZ|nr:hypothetical protein OWV82_003897 [Melia azedarach]